MTRIHWLTIVLIAAAVLECVLARQLGRLPRPLGLVVSMTFWAVFEVLGSLLAIWFVLGTQPKVVRLLGGALGAGALGLALWFAVRFLPGRFYACSLAMPALLAAAIWIIWKPPLTRRPGTNASLPISAFQYSLRDLLLLMVALPALFSIAGTLRSAWYSIVFGSYVLDGWAAPIIAVLGLAAFWATLSPADFKRRCVVVVVGATFAGVLLAVQQELGWQSYVFAMTSTLFQTLLLLFSLLIVRSAGYRAQWRWRRKIASDAGQTP